MGRQSGLKCYYLHPLEVAVCWPPLGGRTSCYYGASIWVGHASLYSVFLYRAQVMLRLLANCCRFSCTGGVFDVPCCICKWQNTSTREGSWHPKPHHATLWWQPGTARGPAIDLCCDQCKQLVLCSPGGTSPWLCYTYTLVAHHLLCPVSADASILAGTGLL